VAPLIEDLDSKFVAVEAGLKEYLASLPVT
jgi:hypothetical protein